MIVHEKNWMNLKDKATLENAFANSEQNALSIDDVMNAIVELGELFAEQDDALVELAGLIEGGE